jgi:hypothetical protein
MGRPSFSSYNGFLEFHEARHVVRCGVKCGEYKGICLFIVISRAVTGPAEGSSFILALHHV